MLRCAAQCSAVMALTRSTLFLHPRRVLTSSSSTSYVYLRHGRSCFLPLSATSVQIRSCDQRSPQLNARTVAKQNHSMIHCSDPRNHCHPIRQLFLFPVGCRCDWRCLDEPRRPEARDKDTPPSLPLTFLFRRVACAVPGSGAACR